MEMTKKILVVVDTNKLGNYEKGSLCCKNYKYLNINKHLHQGLVDNFSFKSSKNIIIKVAIPDIVLEELKQQQKSNFIEDLKKIQNQFEKFKDLENTELKISELNYDLYLESKKNSYLGRYDIESIEIPSKEVFNKLVDKVLKKKKPFYKKNNNSDSGFKDALIWESILEFVSKNKYDEYFFLTDDLDFDDDSLKQEFFEKTGKEIKIVKEIADLKGMLEEEIKGTNLINESLETIYSFLANSFRDIIHSNYVEIVSEGNLYNVEEVTDFQILDINSSEKDFLLSVVFYLEHESLYSVHAKCGTFDQTFINHAEISPAETEIIISKDYKIKEIKSNCIMINGEFEVNFK